MPQVNATSEMMKTCEHCGAAFESGNPRRRTCSRSCAVAAAWKKNGDQRRANLKWAANTPEAKERLSAFNRERWSRPGERERLSEQNRREWAKPRKRQRRIASITAVNGSPEKRAFYSRMRIEAWASDPEYRRKTEEGIRRSKGSPEYRALFSQLLKERWDDPAWRKKYVDGIRRENNRPERKAELSARMRDMWANNAEFRAIVAASMEFYWSRPEAREFHSARMKALWADPIWRLKTLDRMVENPGAVKVYKHLNSATDLMAAVNAVIPAGLPDFTRMDIASDITLALLEGGLKLSNLKTEAKTYIAAHRKMFPDKWGPISIDAPLPGTDGLTIADTLSNDSPRF